MVNVWRKAIPQQRDRMQSRILVGLLGPVLVLLCMTDLTFWMTRSSAARMNSLEALAISLAFASVAWKLGSATPGAAVCGGLICLLLTQMSGIGTWSLKNSGLLSLVALFVLTFAATRAGKTRKTKAGLAEDHKGRNAAQVIANLGVAALVASVSGGQNLALTYKVDGRFIADFYAIPVMALAALTEATADTVSSEIGQAFGGKPILLATFKRVEPGTDGAVTLLGTLAGIAAGTLVAAIGTATLRIGTSGFLIALAAGTAGLFFDSLLGATIERRGWLGNDWVNFTSTVFAALFALALLALRWHWLL